MYKHILKIDGQEIEKIYDKEIVEHEFVSMPHEGVFKCSKKFITKGELCNLITK